MAEMIADSLPPMRSREEMREHAARMNADLRSGLVRKRWLEECDKAETIANES